MIRLVINGNMVIDQGRTKKTNSTPLKRVDAVEIVTSTNPPKTRL